VSCSEVTQRVKLVEFSSTPWQDITVEEDKLFMATLASPTLAKTIQYNHNHARLGPEKKCQ